MSCIEKYNPFPFFYPGSLIQNHLMGGGIGGPKPHKQKKQLENISQ